LAAVLSATPTARPSMRWIGAVGVAVAAVAASAIVLGRSRPVSTRPTKPAAIPAAAVGAAIVVDTTPAGAIVTRGGAAIGETPMTLSATPGDDIAIELSLPGYVTVARHAVIGADPVAIHADLALATGFDGIWRLPSGELRVFERSTDQVAGFRLRSPTARREFLRFFAFTTSPRGAVAFAASEPFVYAALPDEPSCNIPLQAEYQYRPSDDVLMIRRQGADITVVDGHCVVHATTWSALAALTRVAGMPADRTRVESLAGAAQPPTTLPQRTKTKKPPLTMQPPFVPDATSPGANNTASVQQRSNDDNNMQGDQGAPPIIGKPASPIPAPQAQAPAQQIAPAKK
jgi:PEGA domain